MSDAVPATAAPTSGLAHGVATRLGRWRGWPRTLSGRLALILVVGMLATQLVTGTVWFDARYGRVAEVPVRAGGARIANAIKLVEVVPPAERALMMARLMATGVHIHPIAAPAHITRMAHFSDDLFDNVLSTRLGTQHRYVAHPVVLQDSDGEPVGLTALLSSRTPVAHLMADVQLLDGEWLRVAVVADQAGVNLHPGAAFADYFLRIYLMRILAVVLIAVVAVRIALRPLARLSEAADRLGRDIHSAPLDESGPSEVRQAAQTFNAMQHRLIEAMQERTAFLAAISHDLRSPLTRLRLRAETLTDTKQRARFRNDLVEMEAMIAASLDHVRGVPTGEPLRDVDVDALLRAVAQDAAETGGEVLVRSQFAGTVRGYPRTLRRCVQNLVDNAVRHAGGCLLSVEADARGAFLDIVVADDGPGIPEAQIEAATKPFVRLMPTSEDAVGSPLPSGAMPDGAGLGLAIARTIAQAHGGELILRNRETGGLRAVLRLPIAPADTIHATK